MEELSQMVVDPCTGFPPKENLSYGAKSSKAYKRTFCESSSFSRGLDYSY